VFQDTPFKDVPLKYTLYLVLEILALILTGELTSWSEGLWPRTLWLGTEIKV